MIRFDNVSKSYPDGTEAVRDFSLQAPSGQTTVLVGSSGCGKTTLLRMLAGFEIPDGGRIVIDGQDMTGVPPHLRPVNMMFQSYALFPHMSVEKNVAFGLEQEKLPRTEIARRVAEMLDIVRLGEFAKRKPHQLSGGQRQRVAMGRAIVRRPDLFLFDEPLSNLDAALRSQVRVEIRKLHDRLGAIAAVIAKAHLGKQEIAQLVYPETLRQF